MKIPLLNGIYVDTNAQLRTSYPRNLIPVPKSSGISEGYLSPSEGLALFASGPGIDRGGINWNGILYRVMGSELVSIDQFGNLTIIGDVGGAATPVSFAYSFDRLAITSNNKLYYWNNFTLTQVVDSDLGDAQDLIWVDGYFLVTDGSTMVVTDLADPLSINPLKYGSAEADPDPILALLKLRDEPTVIGRYTIEVLQNVGGNLFPFQRISGSEILRGAVGRKAACVFMEQIAFLGSGKNEPCAVYMAINGTSTKVSTAEIDAILKSYKDADLNTVVVEPKLELDHSFLYVHLPDKTLVFDYTTSLITKTSVWFTLDSGLGFTAKYRARNFVWVYNRWIFGDPTVPQLGTFTQNDALHFGNIVTWEFGTFVLYNETNGIIIHELELIALTGSVDPNAKPYVWTSYSTDGVTWSLERPQSAARIGNRNARIVWLQCGNMRAWRIQKFKGNSLARISIIALDARIEALNA